MEKNRDQIIVKTSIIGIVANVLFATFKAMVGLLFSSIAIVLDTVNNLSDALSSLIKIIDSKLSQKVPDKKHPPFIESLKSILNPETPDYSTVALIIVVVAVIVKIVLGKYVETEWYSASS